MKNANKIFKLLGINYSYLPCFKYQDYDVDFFENVQNGPLNPLKDIDKVVHQKKDEYRENFLFQMIYSFLSQFSFKNKADLKECESLLKTSILNDDIKGLKASLAKIKTTHNKVSCINEAGLDEDIKALNKYFCNSELCRYLENILNDESVTHRALVSGGLPVTYILNNIIFAWLFLRKDILNVNFKNFTDRDVYNLVEEYVINKLNLKGDSINSKQKFLDYCYKYYYNNGYVYHGTNDHYLKNILKNGLDSNKVTYNTKIINQQNELMEKYGIENAFEGKTRELGYIQCYMSTKTDPATYYSVQSPEWLSRFCANGEYMYNCKYDRWAFYRRDFSACLNNLKILCDEYNFTSLDKKTTVKNFKLLWKHTMSLSMNPVIVLLDRNQIAMDKSDNYTKVKQNLKTLTYSEILHNLIDIEQNFIRVFSRVPNKFFKVVKLPKVNSLLKVKTNSSKEKWVIDDGNKVNVDGILRFSMVEIPTRCFINFNDANKTCHIKGPIIYLNSNIKQLKELQVEDIPLSMLLPQFGVAINKEFDDFLTKLKESVSKKQTIKWYKDYASTLAKTGQEQIDKDEWQAYKTYCKLVFAISVIYTLKNLDKFPNQIDPHKHFNIQNRAIDQDHWAIDCNRNKMINTKQLKQNFLRLTEQWL